MPKTNFSYQQKETYCYVKLRKTFGAQPLFQDVSGHLLDSIPPNKMDQKMYILRNPVTRAVQATVPLSEHDSNTKEIILRDRGMNHTEGGWPNDVNLDNEDHVQRHCRHALHQDNYINTVKQITPRILHHIEQNNAINMYQTYYNNMTTQKPVEKYDIEVKNEFKHERNIPVSCLGWTDEKKSKLVVSYCYKDLIESSELNTINECNLWDITRQNSPITTLQCKEPCWVIACAPNQADIILAGVENGTVNLFDVRQQTSPVSSTSPYNSHRSNPITALLFVHDKFNSQFFTGSLDGQCLWWDMRKLSEPLESLPISVHLPPGVTPDLSNSEAVSTFEFDKNYPSRFLCGTESGLVVNVNRNGRDYSEIMTGYWNAHTGPVKAVDRSACSGRMFLTCGDWSVRIWSEEIRREPIIFTKHYRYQVNDAIWNPMRYSSYMAITEDGVFHYWDFLRTYEKPLVTYRVSNHSLLTMCADSTGQSVAVGDSNGGTFLLKFSDCMMESEPREKSLMQLLYERETHREHILDIRLREIRLKAKGEEVIDISEPDEDEIDMDGEKTYWETVDEEHLKLFGIPHERTTSSTIDK